MLAENSPTLLAAVSLASFGDEKSRGVGFVPTQGTIRFEFFLPEEGLILQIRCPSTSFVSSNTATLAVRQRLCKKSREECI